MQDILSYYLDIMENEEVIQEKVPGQALGCCCCRSQNAKQRVLTAASDAVVLGRIGY